jgi:hypothetical protein
MKKSLIYITVVFAAATCLMVSPAKADQQAITIPDAGFDDHVLAAGDWVDIGEGPYAETSDYIRCLIAFANLCFGSARTMITLSATGKSLYYYHQISSN